MSINQIIALLLSRKILAIGIFFVILSLVVGITFVLPERYTSKAVIAVDTGMMDPVTGMPLTGTSLATQVDIIQSHRVAEKAVAMMGLDKVDALVQQYESRTDPGVSLSNWIASKLLSSLEVVPAGAGSVLNVSYDASEPRFAAAMANGFVAAYKEVTLENRIQIATENSRFFRRQIGEARKSLEQAQADLITFQRENDLLSMDSNRLDIEIQRLSGLTQLVTQAEAEAIDARSKTLRNAPGVLQNPVIQQLTQTLVDQKTQLSDLKLKTGPNHPDYRRLAAQIASTEGQLRELKSEYASSMQSTAENIRSRLDDQKLELEEQKQYVLELQDKRSQLATLEGYVALAKSNYDATMQKLTETMMQSDTQITNIMVLSEASPPGGPAFPKLNLNIFIGVFLGIFGGIAISILRELLDRRVRCVDDVELLVGIPVVSKVSRAMR